MFMKFKIILIFVLLVNQLSAQDVITVNLDQTYGLDEEYIFSLEKMERGNFPSIRGNEFTIDGKKYSIAITDFDKDNIFGDHPDDYIHLVPFGGKRVPQFPSLSNNVVDFKDTLIVELDDFCYQLTVLDKNIPIVRLNKLLSSDCDSSDIDISCYSGMPFYKLEDFVTGRKYNPKELKSNYVVFYFWGTWCEGCRQAIVEIKKFMETSEDVDFVFFNWEDSKADALKYINKEHLLFANHYLATETIKKDFAVNAFPTFVVYHDNKYVARFNFVANLMKFLKK